MNTHNSSKKLIVVGGPTASGKTELAVRLAEQLNTEIISADSRQFYREMRIGTARPASSEMRGIKHHFLGHVSVEFEYSAGIFAKEAQEVIHDLFSHHDRVVVVGGSGFYLDALLFGNPEIPPCDPKIRTKWNHRFKVEGLEGLQTELERIDPEYYQIIDTQNPKRLIRALEVVELTGKSVASFSFIEKKKPRFAYDYIAMDWPRDVLYQRINARVDKMMQDGLLEEAKTLLPHAKYNALQTVGYKELFAHFEGAISLEEAIRQIKQNTRRYAKRQLTWLRNKPEIAWISPAKLHTAEIMEFLGG
jgi:tRNA dimethylallyltransferase